MMGDWFFPKSPQHAPEVKALPEPIVDFCGVCSAYGAHGYLHGGLSSDGRDCALQVRNPVLLCLECLDAARWSSELLRADLVRAAEPLSPYQLRACVLSFERSGARRRRPEGRRR